MNEQPRWPLQALLPILAGLAWLAAAQQGLGSFLVAGLPGAVGPLLVTLGSLGLMAVFLILSWLQRTLFPLPPV